MSKGLLPDEVELLRRVLRERLIPLYGNDRGVAKALAVHPSTIHRLREYGSGSSTLMDKFARGAGFEDVTAMLMALRGRHTLGASEGFDEALREAQRLRPDIPEEVWNIVPTVSWTPPVRRATPMLVMKAAEAVALDLQHRASSRIPIAPKVLPSPPKALPPAPGSKVRRKPPKR